MSILISGMEMPTEGTVIAIYKIDGKLYATRGLSGRLCPLVEIPPHGDLIDRDALMVKVEHDTPLSDVYEKTMRRYLKAAPTIIPEEEGE